MGPILAAIAVKVRSDGLVELFQMLASTPPR